MSRIIPFGHSQNTSSSTHVTNKCQGENDCANPAKVICHHCKKDVCLNHLLEHNKLNCLYLDKILNEMTNTSNDVSMFNIHDSIQNARNKLESWKTSTLDEINNLYKHYVEKINNFENELNRRLDIYKEDFNKKSSNLQQQLLALKKQGEISQEEITLMESNVNQLREYSKSVQCKIDINIKPSTFNNFIKISKIFSYDCSLSKTNFMQVQSYQTIPVENMKSFTTSQDERYILWSDNEQNLHYINKYLQSEMLKLPQTIKSTTEISLNRPSNINDTNIVDIKWFPSVELFLILFQRNLFSFNPKTYKFTQISLARFQNYPFQCMSYLDDKSFYLSNCKCGVSIHLLKYSSNDCNDFHIEELIKSWDSLTNDKHEWISSMNVNSISQIGLLIRTGSTMKTRFELRDKDINLLNTFQLDDGFIIAFYPLRCSHWFFKCSSDKYYVYSTQEPFYRSTLFNFPGGLQEFGKDSIIIGNDERELKVCDIY